MSKFRDDELHWASILPETEAGTPSGAQGALRLRFAGTPVEVDIWSDGTFTVSDGHGSVEANFEFLYDDAWGENHEE